MFVALLVVQTLLGLAIIGLVLLQQGKGADMGAAFGSGASGTVFGARGGGSFFTRATAVLATLFFANSILLSSPLVLDRSEAGASVTEKIEAPAPAPAPVEAPAAKVPAPADLPDLPEAPAAGEPADGKADNDLPQ